MQGLRGKVALIAGAAEGNIGAATAIRLAREGMHVVTADLNEANAKAVADEITAAGGSAVAKAFDITDETSYKELIEFTVDRFGGLHGLFNVAADLSARTMSRDTDVTSVPLDIWQHTIDVTLSGYMYGIRHALPIMMEQGTGSIVNTMSSVVWMGKDVAVSYQTAKSGLVGLTRHTATVGGKHGVRCNLISPGVILSKASLAATTEQFREETLASVRSTRLGVPDDLAGPVAFLFSDDSFYINGQSFLVDGGANFT
ncbi:SDR family NAD(P)-dependent oxidoreductase [Streptomyces sp. NBC_00887]|uniref:SDR family NAD(P)-dependent oxidoreductase n=1 Tax=Streptomyces sp. NBC_00887 TaxID=2975859 RepID=UPI00386825EB|nr:SDR family oxidoreductase [Streptomyces sp. NBC_00887]WSY36264.1 SDR family oxidoreductase [Streptomyces sp. NBC_00887]